MCNIERTKYLSQPMFISMCASCLSNGSRFLNAAGLLGNVSSSFNVLNIVSTLIICSVKYRIPPTLVQLHIYLSQETGSPSRLCKSSFYRRWIALVNSGQLSFLAQTSVLTSPGPPSHDPMQYNTAKAEAADFQAAKEQLFCAFKKAELGSWVKKPMEQDEFALVN